MIVRCITCADARDTDYMDDCLTDDNGNYICKTCYDELTEMSDMSEYITVPVTARTTEVSVDTIYTCMTEGQRQHMANKLWKRGYHSPKAGKVINVDGVDYRLVRDGE